MNKYQFYYMNKNKKNCITLKKGLPEWCNLDCPDIYYKIEGDNFLYKLNSGLYMEYVQREVEDIFVDFIIKSSLLFYKKYPQCKTDKNGFVSNFLYNNNKLNNLSDENRQKLSDSLCD